MPQAQKLRKMQQMQRSCKVRKWKMGEPTSSHTLQLTRMQRRTELQNFCPCKQMRCRGLTSGLSPSCRPTRTHRLAARIHHLDPTNLAAGHLQIQCCGHEWICSNVCMYACPGQQNASLMDSRSGIRTLPGCNAGKVPCRL